MGETMDDLDTEVLSETALASRRGYAVVRAREHDPSSPATTPADEGESTERADDEHVR